MSAIPHQPNSIPCAWRPHITLLNSSKHHHDRHRLHWDCTIEGRKTGRSSWGSLQPSGCWSKTIIGQHRALVLGWIPRVFFLENSSSGWCLCWDWCSQWVEIVRETSFLGKAFGVERAIFVGQVSDWEGFRCWPNNLVDAGNIGRWSCEGFVGI